MTPHSPYTTRCEGVYNVSGNATANATLDFKVSDSQNVASYCEKVIPLHLRAQVGVLCAIQKNVLIPVGSLTDRHAFTSQQPPSSIIPENENVPSFLYAFTHFVSARFVSLRFGAAERHRYGEGERVLREG